jgi:hypothetical protein
MTDWVLQIKRCNILRILLRDIVGLDRLTSSHSFSSIDPKYKPI